MPTRRVVILAVAFFFCSAFVAVKDELFLISKNLDIFSAVYRQVSINYVDQTDAGKLIKTAVDAMLDELDPYTEYVQDTDVEDYKLKYVDTRYSGIGAAIFLRDDRVYLSETYAGYPAAEAGLQAGDELVAVDGQPLTGLTTGEISHLLRGAEDSPVVLGIRKSMHDESEEVLLIRAAIRQPNVSHIARLDKGIGYIKLDKFLEQSADEVAHALGSLEQKTPLRGLVIDLRDNGGGILQEAVKIVGLFVPRGELVVSQRGKNSTKNRSYRTMADPVAPEVPLVVLINGHSASAAEIVAGALQDMDRAVIIGERSFGKGLVQQTFNVPYNNLVKVTVAKYYTPAGRCIQSADIAHKDVNGRYPLVPDSAIHAFSTRRGRVVYDGSGIYPDLAVARAPYSPITQTLLAEYLLFDYATAFRATTPTIADVAKFEVSDDQYEDFMQFLEGKDYHYLEGTAQLLHRLKVEARLEKQPTAVIRQLELLEDEMQDKERVDLIAYRDEIKQMLGAEIVSRYHYRAGKTTYSMQHDPQLKRATMLLAAETEYYSILSGEGEYRIIGNPETILAAAP